MSEAAASGNVLTAAPAGGSNDARRSCIARWLSPVAVTEWVYRQHLAVSGGADWWQEAAGIKIASRLAGAFTGSPGMWYPLLLIAVLLVMSMRG